MVLFSNRAIGVRLATCIRYDIKTEPSELDLLQVYDMTLLKTEPSELDWLHVYDMTLKQSNQLDWLQVYAMTH